MMRWGLIPFWAKEVSIGYKMINAKAETVSEKPSFRKPFKEKRCLVIADGFYEWKKPDKKTKIPFRFVLKNREPFAFAGLWDLSKDLMPVILHEKDESKWLDPEFKDTDKLKPLLVPFPSNLMEAYEVSSIVNSPKNETPKPQNVLNR